MRDQGAELVHGDLDDPGSLREAMRGAYGVFSVQALAYEHENLAREVHQGKALRSQRCPQPPGNGMRHHDCDSWSFSWSFRSGESGWAGGVSA
ncbi:NmrA family NAD(P)-binding protein [Nonomuraea fuscirosea]|uniref:NmrA family NAD(P)-binding protein n=1 Tax=Nonomuraea fuscirosea TaxID=1291556 RepID=UPI003440BD1F